MSEHAERIEAYLAALPPTFTAAQATRAGLSSRDLGGLLTSGRTGELSRGVYRKEDAAPTAHLDLIAVHARAPHAVIAGESALALHDLIDDIPLSVHIAVPRGSTRPVIAYPPVKVAQYATATFDVGIDRFEAALGEYVPVYDGARAIVDGLRGGVAARPQALGALNRYLRLRGQAGVADLEDRARVLGGMSVLGPALEAVLA
jgi:predicted transcriptional regulator of viral defense system